MSVSDKTCAFCGLHYREFRTGLSYREVYDMLWVASDDPSEWRYKGRHTVLGLWHSIKKQMWAEHELCCEEQQHDVEYEEERHAIMNEGSYSNVQVDDVPF